MSSLLGMAWLGAALALSGHAPGPLLPESVVIEYLGASERGACAALQRTVLVEVCDAENRCQVTELGARARVVQRIDANVVSVRLFSSVWRRAGELDAGEIGDADSFSDTFPVAALGERVDVSQFLAAGDCGAEHRFRISPE